MSNRYWDVPKGLLIYVGYCEHEKSLEVLIYAFVTGHCKLMCYNENLYECSGTSYLIISM